MAEKKGASAGPLVVITGAAGSIGSALGRSLMDAYEVVGLDLLADAAAPFDIYSFDITDPAAISYALDKLKEEHGRTIAAVVHLAAYFDFSGEESPLYDQVNVEGTKRLLQALQAFEVERFVYSGTMLVHEAVDPGERIDEDTPIAPKWAYPKSKAKTEDVIREHRGAIPCTILRLAGLYDEKTAVPTLAEQIARIYERGPMAHLYAGDLSAGQSMLHKADMIEAMRRTIDRRRELPAEGAILIGEPEAMSYRKLQDRIGALIHGEEHWRTIAVPEPVAKIGAQVQVMAEPVVPNSIDQGEKPFIRPFMIDMASDHYALDISRARHLLDWEPKHRLADELPKLITNLKENPPAWYDANGITQPPWMQTADEVTSDVEALRRHREMEYRAEHRRNLWAPFFNLAMGSWLLTSPPMLGYESALMIWSDVVSGILLMVFGALSLSWRMSWARWVCAGIGLWVLSAPVLFWAPTAAAYLNDTLVGAIVFALALCVRPAPNLSPVAAETGPSVPKGWDYSPSDWFQRLPIIFLAFIGLYFSRYLTAYQLGHVDYVWEPFFAGGPDPKNGTEEIITSSVSQAWPVPDAGVGALTYMLEILIGVVGSARRWRTMPWLVLIFGIMIIPLGAVSITFIIIQPIVIGTWCTLCLIGAAAMLLQIPYSVDEVVATIQFMRRRWKAGKGFWRILFVGDTDEDNDKEADEDFERGPVAIFREMLIGGMNLPWNLAALLVIGLWLMFTRLTVGAEGVMADADHLIGALVITFTVTATAEVARPVRFFNMPLGLALLLMPFLAGAPLAETLSAVICGLLIIGLSFPRGPVRLHYGSWTRYII